MEYNETVDDKQGIVFVKITGALTRKELGPAATATRAKALKLGYVLLFYYRFYESQRKSKLSKRSKNDF